MESQNEKWRHTGETLEFLLVLDVQPAVDRSERRLLVGELGVKVCGKENMSEEDDEDGKGGVQRTRCVERVLDVREVGWRDLLVVDGVKVDVGEEGVSLDIQRVVLARAKSLGGVALEELSRVRANQQRQREANNQGGQSYAPTGGV